MQDYAERMTTFVSEQFAYDHLPLRLQGVAKPFYDLALTLVGQARAGHVRDTDALEDSIARLAGSRTLAIISVDKPLPHMRTAN